MFVLKLGWGRGFYFYPWQESTLQLVWAKESDPASIGESPEELSSEAEDISECEMDNTMICILDPAFHNGLPRTLCGPDPASDEGKEEMFCDMEDTKWGCLVVCL